MEEVEETYCYGHPDTPTKLRCSRCDRPICGRCAIPASVGQHCPECVAEARKGQRTVKSAMRATAPAVMTIIVLNVVVFVAQNLIPDLTTRYASFPFAIAHGEWWRLLTPMFLHSTGFIFHIVMNMYVLYIFGPQVEQTFGTVRFVVMYLVAGFFASAASYALGPCNVLGVGASGAIFGVVGILLVFLYRRRSSQFVAGYLRQLLIFVGLNVGPGVRHSEHRHVGACGGPRRRSHARVRVRPWGIAPTREGHADRDHPDRDRARTGAGRLPNGHVRVVLLGDQGLTSTMPDLITAFPSGL